MSWKKLEDLKHYKNSASVIKIPSIRLCLVLCPQKVPQRTSNKASYGLHHTMCLGVLYSCCQNKKYPQYPIDGLTFSTGAGAPFIWYKCIGCRMCIHAWCTQLQNTWNFYRCFNIVFFWCFSVFSFGPCDYMKNSQS